MTRDHSVPEDERQPVTLAHPLDVPPARSLYLTAMALQQIASPIVLVATILLVWSVSTNPVTPVAGPVIGLTVTCYVERRYRADAWAHIARRLHDVGRPDPAPWAQIGMAAPLLLLGAGTALFVERVRSEEIPGDPSVGLGMLAGLVLVELAVVAWDRQAEPARRSSGMAPALRIAQGLIASVIAAVGVVVLAGAGVVGLWSAALGALTVVGVSVGWYLLRLVPAKVRCVPNGFPLP